MLWSLLLIAWGLLILISMDKPMTPPRKKWNYETQRWEKIRDE